MKKRKPGKKWGGYASFNIKTGKRKWKTKRDQKTRNYKGKPIKGEHLYKPKSGRWTENFKLLVKNFERKREQGRRIEKKGEQSRRAGTKKRIK
jgi:hypothetical protein